MPLAEKCVPSLVQMCLDLGLLLHQIFLRVECGKSLVSTSSYDTRLRCGGNAWWVRDTLSVTTQ